MKKCLFPIDVLVVWCPTWSKNLSDIFIIFFQFKCLHGNQDSNHETSIDTWLLPEFQKLWLIFAVIISKNLIEIPEWTFYSKNSFYQKRTFIGVRKIFDNLERKKVCRFFSQNLEISAIVPYATITCCLIFCLFSTASLMHILHRINAK